MSKTSSYMCKRAAWSKRKPEQPDARFVRPTEGAGGEGRFSPATRILMLDIFCIGLATGMGEVWPEGVAKGDSQATVGKAERKVPPQDNILIRPRL